MSPVLRHLSVILALGTLLTAPARADDVKAGDLVISQPWSRATPGGAKVAGGYLTVENNGSVPDRLIAGRARSPAGWRCTKWPPTTES